jgi:hypothetical protein
MRFLGQKRKKNNFGLVSEDKKSDSRSAKRPSYSNLSISLLTTYQLVGMLISMENERDRNHA